MNIALKDIMRASERLKPILHHTELDLSSTFSAMTGGNIYLKCENRQKTGSFKIRGASNKIAALVERGEVSSVVASSAGNHAQGVAYAAKKFGIPATIVMPQAAPIAKVQATEGYGAKVVLAGDCYDAAYTRAREICDSEGSTFLHPYNDPEVIAGARAGGVPDSWIKAAQESPIWKLISVYKVALPLHPEYRTLPMVWYIPPLSPVVDAVTASGADGENHRLLYTAISTMRIPLEYLAELFTAGDAAVVEKVLRKLVAMRSFMREVRNGREPDPEIAAAVGMDGQDIEDMYRLLAIAKYDERYVIPTAHSESAATPDGVAAMGCSLDDFGGPGMGGPGGTGVGADHDPNMSVEELAAQFHGVPPEDIAAGSGRVPLATWSAGERPDSMFPGR